MMKVRFSGEFSFLSSTRITNRCTLYVTYNTWNKKSIASLSIRTFYIFRTRSGFLLPRLSISFRVPYVAHFSRLFVRKAPSFLEVTHQSIDCKVKKKKQINVKKCLTPQRYKFIVFLDAFSLQIKPFRICIYGYVLNAYNI